MKMAPTGFCIHALAIKIHSADRLVASAKSQVTARCFTGLKRFQPKSAEVAADEDTEATLHTFDELIAEIRDLKTGAFAPLTDQPFIRAVLFPGAAVGLLAVGQRLFDIF